MQFDIWGNEIEKLKTIKKYRIEKLNNYLSGISGLGKHGEGETFYSVQNN